MSSSSITVEVRRGLRYAELDRRQREIAQAVRGGAPGRLLLTEVLPVITRGRRAPSTTPLLLPEPELAHLGIEVYPTDRGGFDTWHGPGQWVLFPVDRLEALSGDSRGVRKTVEALLDAALEVGRFYDPTAQIREGAETGVWTSRGKFAAVGVHVEQGVLLHGMAVNALRAATSFIGLRPCGLDAPVDYLLEGSGRPAAGPDAFDLLGKRLAEAVLSRLWPGNLSVTGQLRDIESERSRPVPQL